MQPLMEEVEEEVEEEDEKEEKEEQEEDEEGPAEKLWNELKDWWNLNGDGPEIAHAQHVRQALFKKVKLAVPADLWIAGAAQPGETQHVTTVVSEEYALNLFRERFVKACKEEHAEEEERDFGEGGTKTTHRRDASKVWLQGIVGMCFFYRDLGSKVSGSRKFFSAQRKRCGLKSIGMPRAS